MLERHVPETNWTNSESIGGPNRVPCARRVRKSRDPGPCCPVHVDHNLDHYNLVNLVNLVNHVDEHHHNDRCPAHNAAYGPANHRNDRTSHPGTHDSSSAGYGPLRG